LIVCTVETGIREMASLLRMCPLIINAVKGRVVMTTSREGFLTPFFSAGMCRFKEGNTDANQLRRRHQPETKTNCRIVRVTGLGNASRICFEEVLDMTEAKYHIENKACSIVSYHILSFKSVLSSHTTSAGETGAFNASAISMAFWLTLPLLVRIVFIASLKLFCRPCLAAE
jgi:hypothetical protein